MKRSTQHKDEKYSSLLSKFASEYFLIESNKDSLITVTKTDIFDHGKRAIVFFTAIPEDKEESALEFAKRRRNDFRKFVMSKKSFGYAPKIDFMIDKGEHNRQKIDELLRQSETENDTDIIE